MKSLLVMLAVAVPLLAQSTFPKHNVTAGLGAGLPGGDLNPYFADSFGGTIGYGYRFHRNFQADAGLDLVMGAGRVKDFWETQEFGALRIRDYQWFVPLGGRAILPLADDRVLLAAGGGAAYMRYGERIRQPFQGYRIECPMCMSRSGWGSYALVSINVFPDRYRFLRLGTGARIYRGHTSGQPIGSVPGVRTLDRWVNLFGEVGFSF